MFQTQLINIHSQFSSVIDQIPGVFQPSEDLEHSVTSRAIKTVTIGAITLLVLTIIAALTNGKTEKLKKPLFVTMVATIVIPTFIMIAGTVGLNLESDSGGPVHWHADVEYWACGNELELRNPTGTLSNKIGTATYHEHDDHRIHLEGVVVEAEVDASLGKFMHVVGGAITEDALVVPLDKDVSLTLEDEVDGDGESKDLSIIDSYLMQDGDNGRVAYFTSGQNCGDQEAEVQTFVYRYNEENDTYKQYKLDDQESLDHFGIDTVAEFSIYEDSNVPPGDCIIFEFDRPKAKTDKLCEQYGVRDVNLCESFGVEPNKRGICQIEQVDYDYDKDYYLDLQKQPSDETESEDVLGITSTPDDAEVTGVRAGAALGDSSSAESNVLGATSDDAAETTSTDAQFNSAASQATTTGNEVEQW